MVHRIVRVANPHYKRSGRGSYLHALNKYKFNPTKKGPYHFATKVRKQGKFGWIKLIFGKGHKERVLQKTVGASGKAGNVPATDIQKDAEYLCPVTIGSDKKVFSLDFDTGSSDLWVFSTELPKNTKTSGHTVYDPSQSTTAKQMNGSTWKIQYGDQSSASGDVYTDTVTIGGVTITNQAIELAKQLSDEFSSGAGDGLLGLAWPSINTVQPNPVKTPVANAIAEGAISQGLFTAHLASYRDDGQSDGTSFYTIGAIDTTVPGADSPTYAPVDNSQGFWQFSSPTASVNGTSVDRSGNTAIADTGTTLALVDDKTVEAIYNAIPGSSYSQQQGGYVFPQTVTTAQLPVVKFAVGDKEFALPKESLAFADVGDGTWYGGVQSRGDMTFDILGDSWLKGQYVIFDIANTRLGVVQRPDTSPDDLTGSSGNSGDGTGSGGTSDVLGANVSLLI